MVQSHYIYITLWIMYLLAGIVPQLIIALEFKKYGFKIMRFYSYLFLFPTIVFPFLLYFFYDVVVYVINSKYFLNNQIVFVTLLVIIPLLGSIIDLIAERVIFEIRPKAIFSKVKASIGKENLLELFDKILNISAEIEDLQHEVKSDSIQRNKDKLEDLEDQRIELRAAFNKAMTNLSNFKNISITEYAYIILIFVFLMLVVGIPSVKPIFSLADEIRIFLHVHHIKEENHVGCQTTHAARARNVHPR